MIGALKSPRRRKYACRECTMRPLTVREAALRACPSTWPPNTCGLPISRLSPRNRLTSSVSSSSRASRSAIRWSMLGLPCFLRCCRSAELEYAFHDHVVTRERADERVVAALGQLGGREGDRGALTAADNLGAGDDVRIIGSQVVVGQTGRHAGIGHRGYIRSLHQHPVMAHRGRGQLARVREGEFDLGAIGGDIEFLLVELHGVITGNLELAELVGCECGVSASCQEHSGNRQRGQNSMSTNHR